MKKEKIRAIIKERKGDYFWHLEEEFNNLTSQIIGEFLRQLKGYFLKNGFEEKDLDASYQGDNDSLAIITQGLEIVVALREIGSFARLSVCEDYENTRIKYDIKEYFNLKVGITYGIIRGELGVDELGEFVLKVFEENKPALLEKKEKYDEEKQAIEEFLKSVISLVKEKIPSNYQVEYSHYGEHTIRIRFNDELGHRRSIEVSENSIKERCCHCRLNDEIELEDDLLNLIETKKISIEEFAKKMLHILNRHKECTQKHEQEKHNEHEITKLLKVALEEKFKGTNFYAYEENDVYGKSDDSFFIGTIDKKVIQKIADTIEYDGKNGTIRCCLTSDTKNKQVQEICQRNLKYDKSMGNTDFFDDDTRDLKKELSLEMQETIEIIETKHIPRLANYIYQYCLEHKEWLTQINKLCKDYFVLSKDFLFKTYELLKEKFKDEFNWELEIKEGRNPLRLNLNFKSDKKAKLDFSLLKIEGFYGVCYRPASFGISSVGSLNNAKIAYLTKEQGFKTDYSRYLDIHNVEDALNLEKDFLESLRDKSLNADNYSAFIYDYFKKHQEIIEVLNENIEEFVLG
ncbi:hypothetical protein [Helicobacter cetorum]|uniref:Uncharacterized protein n=1 Tax=Helicobacter cetorum (strain ATCC BAA-429 / MIT 00-7128) TaxID=182217 RepID=I0EP90_HELC0|nr:hypothetical protein [Helicobacter cetorum]AFI04759.1 hypothetical protein HCW_07505 [Helicobacter cetorum MIT 00-7128]